MDLVDNILLISGFLVVEEEEVRGYEKAENQMPQLADLEGQAAQCLAMYVLIEFLNKIII